MFFRGLFISVNDAGHIYEMLCNWPENEIKVNLIKISAVYVKYIVCILSR